MPKRSTASSRDDAPAAALEELFRTPPDGFVAARNALVAELKGAGEREQAARIAALRRPSAVDWALNVASADDRKELEAFVSAAGAGREAQAAALEGRSEGLREAVGALRAASAALARRASAVATRAGVRGATAAAVANRLGAVAADPGLSDQLRAGRLGAGGASDAGPEPADATDADPFAAYRSTPRPPPRPRPPRSPKAGDTPGKRAGTSVRASKRRDDALARELAEAERARETLHAEAERATERLRRADDELFRSQKAVAKAEAAAAKAAAASAKAEAAAAKAQAALQATQDELDDARGQLAEVQSARDDADDERGRLLARAEEADRAVAAAVGATSRSGPA
jgi:hypothetical protein